jgi:hypothetical protein
MDLRKKVAKSSIGAALTVFAMLVFPGCATGRPNPEASLRARWAKGWVAASGSVRLQEAYHMFVVTESAGHRGPWFATLCTFAEMGMAEDPISGPQLLDLLGAPDVSKDLNDGRTVLVYFYRQRADPDEGAFVFTVAVNGKVTEMGVNTAEVVLRQLRGIHPAT